MNRVCRLARRVQGPVTPDVFAISDVADAPLNEGELRIEAAYISLDPAMRGWINEGRSYVPPVGIGEVMRAYSAGTVIETRNPAFAEGDTVTGVLGCAEPTRERRSGAHAREHRSARRCTPGSGASA